MKIVAFNHIVLPEKEYTELILTKLKYEQGLKDVEDIKESSFKTGVQHVFEKIKESINAGNPNIMFSIKSTNMDDLKMLVNGMLGKFIRRNNA